MQNYEIKTNPVFDAIKHKWNVFGLFISWILVFSTSFIGMSADCFSLNGELQFSRGDIFMIIVGLFANCYIFFVVIYYSKKVLPQKDCYKNATAFREAIELVLRVVECTQVICEEDVDLLSNKNDKSSEDRIRLFQRKIKEYLLEKIVPVLATNTTDKCDPKHEQKKEFVASEKLKIKNLFTASQRLGMFKGVDINSLYSRAGDRIPVKQIKPA
jgi:hypothetical protein